MQAWRGNRAHSQRVPRGGTRRKCARSENLLTETVERTNLRQLASHELVAMSSRETLSCSA
jgi:hypothetical protein